MIRYFTSILASFAFLVALGVAQEKNPAPKKKAVAEQDQKNPDAKKAPGKDAGPEVKKNEQAEEKEEPMEDPKVIVERLKKNFGEVDDNLNEKKDPGDDTRKKQKQIIDDIDKLIKQQNDDKGGGGGGGGANDKGGGANDKGGGANDKGGGANDKGGGEKNPQKKPMGLDDQKKDDKGGGEKGNDQKEKGDGAGKDDKGKKGEGKDKDKLAKKGSGEPKDDKDKDKKDGKGGGDGKGEPKDDKGGGDGGEGKKGDDKKDKNTTADLKMDVWGHLPANRRQEMDAFARERYMDRYQEILRAYYRNIAESSRRKEGD